MKTEWTSDDSGVQCTVNNGWLIMPGGSGVGVENITQVIVRQREVAKVTGIVVEAHVEVFTAAGRLSFMSENGKDVESLARFINDAVVRHRSRIEED